jgi:hypothetical protein
VRDDGKTQHITSETGVCRISGALPVSDAVSLDSGTCDRTK